MILKCLSNPVLSLSSKRMLIFLLMSRTESNYIWAVTLCFLPLASVIMHFSCFVLQHNPMSHVRQQWEKPLQLISQCREYYGPHINPGYSFYLTYLKFDFFPPVEILIFSCHSFTSDHCCSVLCYQQMCTEDSNILDVHHWMCTGPKGRDCCFGKCCFFSHWFSYAKLHLQYLLLCYQSTWSQELCTLFWGPCDLSKPYLLQFSCLCVFKHARKDGLRLQLAILL